MWSAKTRDDGKKKALLEKKKSWKNSPLKYKGEKKIRKKLPDCHKRDKHLFKNHLPLLLLFLSLNTHIFKEQQNHDRQLPEHDARVRVRVLVPTVFVF